MSRPELGPLRWLRPPAQAPVLIAFPQAGSGARSFEGLQRYLGASATVLALQLPGREDRWAEPPATSITGLVAEVVETLQPVLTTPPMLLGCSFGGLLAYEVARRLPAPVAPHTLFLTSCRAPRWWLTGAIDFDEGQALLASLRARIAALNLDEESQQLLERPMSADIELSGSYQPSDTAPLATPIVAIRGRSDQLVTAAQMHEWSASTTGSTDYLELDAGHDLVAEVPAELGSVIQARLVAA